MAELLIYLELNEVVSEFMMSLSDDKMSDEMKEMKKILVKKEQEEQYTILMDIRRQFTTKEIDEYMKAFAEIDEDGSGAIDINELDTLFQGMGHKLPLDALERLVQEVDVDGSGVIEFNEYLLVMKKLKAGQITGLGQVFQKALFKGDTSKALETLGEMMFGASKKTAMNRKEMERQRDKQQRMMAFKKREKAFRLSHLTMMDCKHPKAELLAYARDRSFVVKHFKDTAEQIWYDVDDDNKGEISWRNLVTYLNEEEDTAASIGINMVVPEELCSTLGVSRLAPFGYDKFLDVLKLIGQWCAEASREHGVSHSIAAIDKIGERNLKLLGRRCESQVIELNDKRAERQEKAEQRRRDKEGAIKEAEEARIKAEKDARGGFLKRTFSSRSNSTKGTATAEAEEEE